MLSRDGARKYRAVFARLNYLSTERPDIQFSVNEAARAMANPTREHLTLLTKLGRYLAGRPRMVIHFKFQKPVGMLTTFSDSDWAGCGTPGKSTSGGLVKIGCHAIKRWSRQQKVLALGSAEAEAYGVPIQLEVMAPAESPATPIRVGSIRHSLALARRKRIAAFPSSIASVAV